jgi:hypothetical protein
MTGAGEAGRCVDTKAIRQAVQGREAEILDALGVPWRQGRPHVQCPYPNHDDHDPSWRWDDRRGRAYCTCIEKSDGIFDVVMKLLGLDFDAAKLRAAELLQCDNLIKTKGDGSARQKTDPQSLLSPPAHNCDGAIPYLYLGARLGVESEEIPPSATKMVGIASLAYFDAPLKNGKSAQPVLVGHWPCCVFETTAADGRRHAHRIYTNATFDGKAELGLTAAGRERDPKKSAQRDPKGPSIAGCCVAWGNPDTEHVILAEGIETACAIAVTFHADLGNGHLAVLSAITAGGIEAFVPWPATRRITVAADRDEAKSGAGFKRGEKAARNLALRLAQEAGDSEQTGRRFEVLIALPGQPGTGYDFLDLFRDTDPDRVRNIVLAAVPFRPTTEEIEEFRTRGRRKTEIERIRQEFPIPPLLGLQVDYRATQSGEIWLHKFIKSTENKETGEVTEIWAPVCTPMTPAAFSADGGRQQHLRAAADDRRHRRRHLLHRLQSR